MRNNGLADTIRDIAVIGLGLSDPYTKEETGITVPDDWKNIPDGLLSHAVRNLRLENEELKGKLQAVDEMLVIHWVSPEEGGEYGDYKKHLNDLISINIDQDRYFSTEEINILRKLIWRIHGCYFIVLVVLLILQIKF